MVHEKFTGHLHPVTHISRRIVGILMDLGFEVALGPELEEDHYNFKALNFPDDHPARDMQDTFWLKDFPGRLLRTQTSNVQVRYMEGHEPPLKIVVPGKVFRNEATDATHEMQFHQIEGLVVGKDISLANLKFTLDAFIKKMFGEDVETRFRPGYFPFVEPGIEVDMKRPEKGNSKKSNEWIEILGAGMVHPNVLENAGVDPKIWQGFAFGVGVDRIAMMKFGLSDVRDLYSGDLRVVNQFPGI
ncbi:MAG: phenylalanine--tRNA ligase subunit alpha [Candidatus Zambryskibacteria bacterium CG10_big_fil_rev_8_21_14_0_10_42_12]|uniref:phenylalanine--tRNA ligase n=1 Tax=Candidatus Zambryskibacteria bacterium CG10_big_fil_rev_8_21_14_0_10_42_12 TaxID=1975115 RepID=A0A2H0QVI1_9BACT|nr:MAG: phenylalanine--tRNA ligase subunit alpha [Candidatus Zambryskibacteria bacterium CG10_big_fil_rev_8_21_14_0_10_42_12]